MIAEDRPILIDFERFAWAQPEWDLAMTATEHCTAGWWTNAEYARFTDAYAWHVTKWDGFDILRAVHEIKMTTWIMQNVDESPEIRAEYDNRMRSLRGQGSPGWQPFCGSARQPARTRNGPGSPRTAAPRSGPSPLVLVRGPDSLSAL
jgi:hypothetical protein